MTEEQIKIDNNIRNRKSVFKPTPQEQFDVWVDSYAFNTGKSREEILSWALTKEYQKELGLCE